MKGFFKWTLVTVSLGCALHVHAQSTLYDSTLGTSGGAGTINAMAWIAQGIETGDNAQGYILDSIQVQMAAATGSPTGFTLSIFSALNGVPSQSLGVLTGSASPIGPGIYTYDASALDLNLAASTEYYLVETATSSASQGSYEWGVVSGYGGAVNGWQNVSTEFSSDQGNDWSPGSRSTFQIAITATAVPEPSTWMLCLLGGEFAFYVHARKRLASQVKLD